MKIMLPMLTELQTKAYMNNFDSNMTYLTCNLQFEVGVSKGNVCHDKIHEPSCLQLFVLSI